MDKSESRQQQQQQRACQNCLDWSNVSVAPSTHFAFQLHGRYRTHRSYVTTARRRRKRIINLLNSHERPSLSVAFAAYKSLYVTMFVCSLFRQFVGVYLSWNCIHKTEVCIRYSRAQHICMRFRFIVIIMRIEMSWFLFIYFFFRVECTAIPPYASNVQFALPQNVNNLRVLAFSCNAMWWVSRKQIKSLVYDSIGKFLWFDADGGRWGPSANKNIGQHTCAIASHDQISVFWCLMHFNWKAVLFSAEQHFSICI